MSPSSACASSARWFQAFSHCTSVISCGRSAEPGCGEFHKSLGTWASTLALAITRRRIRTHRHVSMSSSTWEEIVVHPRIEQLGAPESSDEVTAWELFHENSKSSRYELSLSQQSVARRMQEMCEALE